MMRVLKKWVRFFLVKIKSNFIYLNYYTAQSNNLPEVNKVNSFLIIKSKVEFCNLLGIETPDDYIVERFDHADEFVCIKGSNGYLSRGWISYRRIFFDYDTQLSILNDKYCILYDFETPEVYRGHGYYTLLLRSILNYYPSDKLFLIFAKHNNKASNKAILRAGFKQVNKVKRGVILDA